MAQDPRGEQASKFLPTLLGFFILGQLLFLCASNTILMLRKGKESLTQDAPTQVVETLIPGWPQGADQAWETMTLGNKVFRSWSQVSGQEQVWSLFAPNVYENSWFPALLLRWPDERPFPTTWPCTLLSAGDGVDAIGLWHLLQEHPASLQANDTKRLAPYLAGLAGLQLLPTSGLLEATNRRQQKSITFISDNEPGDINHYFRLGQHRLRRYESLLLANLTSADEESASARNQRWQKTLESHFRENALMLEKYLRWRYAELQRRHPDHPPAHEVILIERHFRFVPDNTETRWIGPVETPLARWRPQLPEDAKLFTLEYYNPVSQDFERMWK